MNYKASYFEVYFSFLLLLLPYIQVLPSSLSPSTAPMHVLSRTIYPTSDVLSSALTIQTAYRYVISKETDRLYECPARQSIEVVV
jgi:hypothetical protein